nr:MAG TPA: hypothetical protein [Caudoviricetes sp.]
MVSIDHHNFTSILCTKKEPLYHRRLLRLISN